MILSEEEVDRITEIRRDLHEHPEISFEEERTTSVVRRILSDLPGIRILNLPVPTGLVAVMNGTAGKSRHDRLQEIALRADIDAIQQTERADVPWKSANDGVMHGCGHDCHTAALLGAAMTLSKKRDQFAGQVDFIFQPAEEITRGAQQLIGAGLFDVIHPERIFGIHNWPSVPVGKIVVNPGPRMAAKINFRIRIDGKGGHGSEPQNNIDPIICAAAIVQSLQTIVSRNMAPMDNVILSVNSINGGSEQNLVVDSVEMTATIRAVQEKALERAFERAQAVVSNTAKAYECRSSVSVEDRIPAVDNPAGLADEIRQIAAAAAGKENLLETGPALASEDFSFYMQKVPSWFFWVGSGAEDGSSAPLHSPYFCPDEGVLETAADLYTAAALYSLAPTE